MQKKYIFAGASSHIAQAARELLQHQGHTVIGISTKENSTGYNQLLTIPHYDFGNFPDIDGDIDGIVYFPGTINLKPFLSLKKEDFTKDVETNIMGAVAFTQKYLPNLKIAKDASIVFISTVAVQSGMPFHSSVSLAKGAIEGLTRALAAELAPKIRVNAIAPSLVDTPLANKFLNTEEKIEAMQKKNPMKKIGAPKDIAQAICFLLSEQSAWVTGQVLAIDGGMGALKI